MTGRTLGHYRILEKLGSGGVGEVYKARDTRLNRTVAIKLFPEGKVVNADRKRRFIQEARSASALNHPISSSSTTSTKRTASTTW